jgi:hypothetical protein
VLIKRRDKVLKAWLTGVNPVVEPNLAADGTLTFENAAVGAGVATPAASYIVSWSRFDNVTGELTGPSEEARISEPRAAVPRGLLEGTDFLAVRIRTVHADYPGWNSPATVYFRRGPAGWETVGLERTR